MVRIDVTRDGVSLGGWSVNNVVSRLFVASRFLAKLPTSSSQTLLGAVLLPIKQVSN